MDVVKKKVTCYQCAIKNFQNKFCELANSGSYQGKHFHHYYLWKIHSVSNMYTQVCINVAKRHYLNNQIHCVSLHRIRHWQSLTVFLIQFIAFNYTTVTSRYSPQSLTQHIHTALERKTIMLMHLLTLCKRSFTIIDVFQVYRPFWPLPSSHKKHVDFSSHIYC